MGKIWLLSLLCWFPIDYEEHISLSFFYLASQYSEGVTSGKRNTFQRLALIGGRGEVILVIVPISSWSTLLLQQQVGLPEIRQHALHLFLALKSKRNNWWGLQPIPRGKWLQALLTQQSHLPGTGAHLEQHKEIKSQEHRFPPCPNRGSLETFCWWTQMYFPY